MKKKLLTLGTLATLILSISLFLSNDNYLGSLIILENENSETECIEIEKKETSGWTLLNSGGGIESIENFDAIFALKNDEEYYGCVSSVGVKKGSEDKTFSCPYTNYKSIGLNESKNNVFWLYYNDFIRKDEEKGKNIKICFKKDKETIVPIKKGWAWVANPNTQDLKISGLFDNQDENISLFYAYFDGGWKKWKNGGEDNYEGEIYKNLGFALLGNEDKEIGIKKIDNTLDDILKQKDDDKLDDISKQKDDDRDNLTQEENNISIGEINKINLSYDEEKQYQVVAEDNLGKTLNYKIENNPDFIEVNNETGVIEIKPSENDLGQYSVIITVSDGSIESEKEIKIGVYLPDNLVLNALNSTGSLQMTQLDSFIESVEPARHALVPNPDGKNWNIIKAYRKKYWTNPEIITIDTAKGNIKKYEFESGYQSRHLFKSVIKGNKIYMNVNAHHNGKGLHKEINIYDTETDSLEINAIKIPEYVQGESHPMVMGTNGKIYGAGTYTDENINNKASVYEIDLEEYEKDKENYIAKGYGEVGPSHTGSWAWGYSVGADDTHIYVASGKVPWYLVSVDIKTGEQKVLLETLTTVGGINVIQGRYGVLVHASGLIDGKESGYYFMYNGEAYYVKGISTQIPPWSNGEDGKIWSHKENYENQFYPSEKPDIDAYAAETGRSKNMIWYRNAEDRERFLKEKNEGIEHKTPEDGGWKSFQYEVNTHPQNIQNLITLSNGKILSYTYAYGGYALYDPRTGEEVFLGTLEGISPYDMIEYKGKVYISGYAGSPLYEYDINKPWTQRTVNDYDPRNPSSKNDQNLNPRFIGQLSSESGVKKTYSIKVGADGYIYLGGRWIREGSGGGLAWYNPETGDKGGIYEILSNYQVRTIAAAGKYIVISTFAVRDVKYFKETPTEGRLFVFDTEKKEIVKTIDPLPETLSTGKIVAIDDKNVIGLATDWVSQKDKENKNTYIYKVNIETGEVEFKKSYNILSYLKNGGNDMSIGMDRVGPDGNIWAFIGTTLTKITPEGYIDIVGKLPLGYGSFDFYENDIYFSGYKGARLVEGILEY